jgi:hypothetical protein
MTVPAHRLSLAPCAAPAMPTPAMPTPAMLTRGAAS